VRIAHPEACPLGEIIHAVYAAAVQTSAMDAVTKYEVWKAIRSALNDGDLLELA